MTIRRLAIGANVPAMGDGQPSKIGSMATVEGPAAATTQPTSISLMPTFASGREASGAPVTAERIGRYRILDRLGAGGMGVVLAAYDPELDRKIALKILRPEVWRGQVDEGRARILREAQAMAKLAHPNVVTVFDVGTTDKHVYIAMELIDGVTLGGWMQSEQRARRDILRVFLGAARGLEAAHRAGLVHRDFKPDNVLLDHDGTPRVTDFGLARTTADSKSASEPSPQLREVGRSALDAPLTQDGAVIGTPAYMAPEQIDGEVADHRSDQFSFCVALYEALAGARPFTGTTLAGIRDAIAGRRLAEPKHAVPSQMLAVISRGLSEVPAARHPSMSALIAALSRDRFVPWRRAGYGAAGLALTGAITIAVTQHRKAEALVCSGGEDNLAGVWDATVRGRVKSALVAGSSTSGAATFERLAGMLDRYMRAWVSTHRTACKATRVHEETLSPPAA